MAAYPKMVPVRQEFKTNPIQDIPGRVRAELAALRLHERITPGASVAVTAGSRGIANIAAILTEVVGEIKRLKARPFIVPAMGSHGGATAEGQRRILTEFGITRERTGAPVKSSLAVVQLGSTPAGLPVFFDHYAAQADHIVVVNRVKPHTDFKAPLESGLMKMMAIGLGKQKGADCYHSAALTQGHYQVILSVGREILKRCPVVCGLALVENQRDETEIIRAIRPEEIEAVERTLLRRAKRMLPRIPLDHLDLLIVDRMGKDVSGTGMDPNVIGRCVIPNTTMPARPRIRRIFVRDFTAGAYGNALGLGNADFTTKRLVDKIDRQATYMNSITAKSPEEARIPAYFDSDRQALDAAFRTIGPVKPELARVVHIADTLRLEEMEISASLVAEAGKNLRVTGPRHTMRFDARGNLISALPTG